MLEGSRPAVHLAIPGALALISLATLAVGDCRTLRQAGE